MRELTQTEMQQVGGGMTAIEAAGIIAGLSMYSPVTMAFGLPIAGSLVLLDYVSQ